MLTHIIEWSLRNRFLVLAGAACAVAIGWVSVRQLNIDAFPDTTPVQVQVNTIVPGLGPEEVERQMTFPIEPSISGLPGLLPLRSLSKFGLSQVVVTFKEGTDIYFARQLVNERLATVETLEGIQRPRLGPVATGIGEVFHYLLTSSQGDLRGAGLQPASTLTDLRTLQDWVLKPALRTVPGTAEINGWGGLEKQILVLLNVERLLKYDLTFAQVVQALHDN